MQVSTAVILCVQQSESNSVYFISYNSQRRLKVDSARRMSWHCFMVLDKVRISQYLEAKIPLKGNWTVVQYKCLWKQTGPLKSCGSNGIKKWGQQAIQSSVQYSHRHLIAPNRKSFFVFALERAYSAAVYKNIETINDYFSSFGHTFTEPFLPKALWNIH